MQLSDRRGQAGFTLIEMMLTMTLTLIIMASTMAAMNNAIRASEVATLTTNMNQGLRTAMDIMVRDMLQVGQGLPSGRIIDVPNGAGVTAMKLPGPPNMSTRAMPDRWDDVTSTWKPAQKLSAIVPGPGLGPTINGVATDVITIVQADGAFLSTISDYDVNLTALEPGKMVVDAAVDISNGGADDLHKGDLIMLMKATSTTLVQVTKIEPANSQIVFFESGDSLGLNQSGSGTACTPTGGTCGTLNAHIATAPGKSATSTGEVPDPITGFVPSTATRIRLVSYYIDNVTDPNRPRLVRRINNGHETNYSNTLYGTAIAFDVENLQITYDLVDSATNPNNVKMTAADLQGLAGGGGACDPNPCSPNQIRKINLTLTGRSRIPMRQTRQYFRNSLTTQISLRSMSFIDRYR